MDDFLPDLSQIGENAAEQASNAANAAQEASQQASNAAEEAANAAEQAAQEAQAAAQQAAQEAQQAAQEAQAAAEQAAQDAQATAEQAVQEAQAAAQQAAQEAEQAAQEAQAAAEQAADEAQAAAQQAAQEAQQAAQEAQAAAAEAAQEAQAAAEEAVQEAQATAEQAAQEAQQAAQEAQAAAEQAAGEAQAAAEQAVQDAQATAEQAAQEAQQTAQEAQAAAEQAVGEAQAAAEQAAQEAQAAAEEAVAEAEQAAQEVQAAAEQAAQEAVAEAEQVAAEAQAAAEEAAGEAQAAAEEAVAEAEAAAEEAVAEAEAAAQAAQEKAATAAAEAQAAVEGMAAEAQAAAEAAVAEATAAAEAAKEQAQAAAAAAQAAAEEALAEAEAMAGEAMAAVEGLADEATGLLEDALADVAGLLDDAMDALPDLSAQLSSNGTNQDVLLSQFFLKIGGKAIPEPEMEALSHDVFEIIVDDSLHLPDMFTITLHDKTLKWVDADLLSIGKEVEISGKAVEGQGVDPPAENVLIKGEITSLEPDFSLAGEPTLLVRGYDRAHRLHRGKYTRSFLQMTDGEIVEKIAKEVGLQTEVAPTSPVHEYVFQNNQTNLEFLLERTKRIGYQLHVEDKTLHFRKAEQDEGDGPELEWGRNITSFRPRLTVMHQVNEVLVRSWDPKTKQEILGQASKGKLTPEVGLGKAGGEVAQQAFNGTAQAMVVNAPVATQDEAQAMAQALCDEISGNFIQAEGVSLGDSRIQAGKAVKIVGLGDRFSGSYVVTGATHTYSPDVGYETAFTISGRQPNTLADLLQAGNEATPGTGVVVGLVTNNNDKEGLGRVKVKYPWLSGDDESHWARMAAPMAGSGRGFYYLPEVNDEVLLAFEHGDIHRPYIVGMLWNGKDKPPGEQGKVVGQDGKVNQRILQSRSGHQIILDDSSGQEKIEIIDKSGNNSLIISTSDNTVTVSGDSKITIQAGGGSQKIVLDNMGQSLELTAGGRSIALKAGQVQIN